MAGRGKKRPVSEAEMLKAESLAYDNCKNYTIECLMGWPDNFIDNRPDIALRLKRKRQEGDSDLLHSQMESAVKSKSPVMQVWVGKNRLGQADKQDLNLSGSVATRELSKEELVELLREQTVPFEGALAK